ncbi:unnamed protein product [Xylocopa violacea]|uniref:Mediator of DNA damage checkpoint protein 1 n=1 Tax=Xylocopa violacea TaxID=135666 RepID=A0ABP1P4D1_XYLVO
MIRYNEVHIGKQCQTVSKKHAEIEANSREASAWICDLDSSNRTKLNNIILRPNRCYELKDGNVLEFGMVKAVYNVCGSMDESLVPETPAPNRLKKQNLIIPATPDSSLENVSMIPATQSDNKESMFRYPSLPIKTSIGSTRKSSLQDSSIDGSLDGSRSTAREHSVGEQRISIHDMETQNSIESHDETDDDIHDVETQKICLTKKIRALAKSPHIQATNIHDLETQCGINDGSVEVTDIHNVETQHDIDIHDMETPKRVNFIRKVATGDDSASNVANLETSETKEEKKLINEKDNDVHNTVTQKVEVNNSTSNSNDADKVEDKVKETETANSSQRYLELSPTNSDDDSLMECDESRNLLGSQPLLQLAEHDDEPSNDANLKSSSPVKVSDANEHDTSNKSTDEENIFDAATQVTKVNESPSKDVPQRVDYPFKARSVADDSNDTDEGCVFQMYSYNRRKDSEKSSKSQLSDSEGSTTDEEGRFAEIALKQKQNASSFFVNHNESKEGKCDASTSRESEDLFDKLTQPANWRTQSKKDSVKEVSFDAPTQVIDTKRSENNEKTNDNTETMEDDDMAPTQILRRSSNSPVKETNPLIPLTETKEKKGASDKEDNTEIDNNAPTQIISTADKATFETDESSSTLDPLKAIVMEDPGVVDIDYEMASTQRISDIEKEMPDACKDVSESSKSSDSIERNLNAMFNDVNEERIEEQPQISTQVLTNVLESPLCKNKLPDQNELSADGKPTTENSARKTTRTKKLKDSTIESPSNSTSNKKPDAKNTNEERSQMSPQVSKNTPRSPKRETANVNSDSSTRKSTRRSIKSKKPPTIESNDNESQSSETYFSTLTSTRKRRIFVDSQDSSEPDEHKLNEKMINEETASKSIDTANDKNNICDVSSKSVSKNSSTTKSIPENQSTETEHLSTPTSSKKRKNEKSKAVETTSKEINVPKHDEESGECSKNTDGQTPSGSVDGTLSNPTSPVSSNSEYRININRNQTKQVPVRIAPKKKEPSRKSTRKAAVRKNVENGEPYRAVNKLNSSAVLRSLLNSFSNNFEVNKMSACENIDEKVNQVVKGSVGKDALVEKVAAEPAKRNVGRARGGKRSYSMMNTIEGSDPKKRKQDVKEDESAGGKGSMSLSNPTELGTIENGNKKTAARRRASVANNQVVSNVSSKENQKIEQHVQTRRSVNQKTASKNEPFTEDISSEVGEESQEVEMIMNSSLKGQIASNVETDIGKNNRGASTRSKRRGNTNVRADDDTIQNSSSASSIVYESDDSRFEAPTLKAKRTRITRNTSSASINESVKKTERTSKVPVRSTRHNQKSITNSSVEENAETVANETPVANVTKGKQSKRKAGKTKNEKQQKDFINETTDTETSFSVENTTMLSTPSRSRRSMSSSFSMASPFKIKHHVLFTGISNNDYGKLLKKLGASQVEDPAKCTVLVTDKVRRTFKFLCALARSIPIVSIDWLVDSEKSGHFMDLESYILKDPTAEANFCFELKRSLEKAKTHKLLEGYTIVLTSNVSPPPLPELKSMIISCGGKPLIRPPQSWPQKAVIISRKEDMANAKKFLAKAPKTVTIQSTEFLLTGILRQELDFSEFKLA